MKCNLTAVVFASLIIGGILSPRLIALDTVTWGGGNGRWEEAKWTKNGTPGLTAAAAMGDNTGGRGGMDISIGGGAQVEFDPNASNSVLGDYNDNTIVDAADYVLWRKGGPLQNEVVGPGTVNAADYTAWRARFGNVGLGDFKPRMDITPGGSLTIKEGAVLYGDSHSDTDGRWFRVGLSITLDNGTIRRTFSAPSENAGRMMFGFHDELLENQHIDIRLINGGRIESASKMVFGELDYFREQGGSNNGHNDGIEIAMTIDNGTVDLTDSYVLDYPFGLIPGDLVFGYEYNQAGWNEAGQPDPSDLGHPRNEKYSINFTGPGSITVRPQDLDPDPDFAQWKGGINVVQQQPDGSYIALGGAPDLFTPIGFEDLWDLGILQANGQSGPQLGSAAFSTYFSTTGTKFAGPYTLTSLVAGSGTGMGGGAVPEPGSFLLVMLGLISLWFGRRSR
jgi:PEP-CTERM motif